MSKDNVQKKEMMDDGKNIISESGKGKNQGKKVKGKVSKTPKVPGNVPKKDHYHRVTYLYKVGSLMLSKQLENYDEEMTNKSVDTLSRIYLNHMDVVSKKAVLKLHPDMKRTMCKQCSRLLVEGVTCTVRMVNNSKKKLQHCDVLEMTCICGTTKRFPVGRDPQYTLFSEKESVLYEMAGKPAKSS